MPTTCQGAGEITDEQEGILGWWEETDERDSLHKLWHKQCIETHKRDFLPKHPWPPAWTNIMSLYFQSGLEKERLKSSGGSNPPPHHSPSWTQMLKSCTWPCCHSSPRTTEGTEHPSGCSGCCGSWSWYSSSVGRMGLTWLARHVLHQIRGSKKKTCLGITQRYRGLSQESHKWFILLTMAKASR